MRKFAQLNCQDERQKQNLNCISSEMFAGGTLARRSLKYKLTCKYADLAT